jgi:zinc-ribbon domain
LSNPDRFCANCGRKVPQDAAFCPNCGNQTASATSTPPSSSTPPPYAYGRHRHEKQEKQEKGEKSEKNEKGRGGDMSGALAGGMILIWLGVTFFLQENGYISSSNWWAYFLMGIGAILIIQGVMRYATSRRPFVGQFIGGAVVFVIGLAFVQGFNVDLWPLILVAIGVAVLLSAGVGRQRRPAP